MTIAEKIKTLRKAAGLTQTELGEKLGVKKNAVSKWECGRVEDIPVSKVRAMSELFGVRPSYLIDNEADENNLGEYIHIIKDRPEIREVVGKLESCTTEDVERVAQIIKLALTK